MAEYDVLQHGTLDNNRKAFVVIERVQIALKPPASYFVPCSYEMTYEVARARADSWTKYGRE